MAAEVVLPLLLPLLLLLLLLLLPDTPELLLLPPRLLALMVLLLPSREQRAVELQGFGACVGAPVGNGGGGTAPAVRFW